MCHAPVDIIDLSDLTAVRIDFANGSYSLTLLARQYRTYFGTRIEIVAAEKSGFVTKIQIGYLDLDWYGNILGFDTRTFYIIDLFALEAHIEKMIEDMLIEQLLINALTFAATRVLSYATSNLLSYTEPRSLTDYHLHELTPSAPEIAPRRSIITMVINALRNRTGSSRNWLGNRRFLGNVAPKTFTGQRSATSLTHV